MNPLNASHYPTCARTHDFELIGDSDDWRFESICFDSGIRFTKQFMLERYTQWGWSQPDFKRECGLTYAQTNFLLERFGIVRRTIGDANRHPNRQTKSRKTVREKYGVDNVSQVDEIQKKKEATFQQHYGVDNIWKSDEFKRWFAEHMQETYGKGSLPNRYGNKAKWWASVDPAVKAAIQSARIAGYKRYWANLSDSEKETIIQNRTRGLVAHYDSSLEAKVCAALLALEIPFKSQYWVDRRSFDFRIWDSNILIEVHGDYWHANPNRYGPDELIQYPDGFIAAKERWAIDEQKRAVAEKHGYRVVVMWESELRGLGDTEIQDLLAGKIGGHLEELWSQLE